MDESRRAIRVDEQRTVSSVWTVPDGWAEGDRRAVILAHGAGNDMDSPFMQTVHDGLAARGLLAVRFNFPYKERGAKAPDRAPILEATWRAVAAAVREDPLAPAKVVLAGKSMGGRIASHLAAEGEPCDGLLFLGYPLHPAGKPEKLRAEHLEQIACPMCFIQGSRDRLCRLDLLQKELERLPAPVMLHVVDDGDHSFQVPKRIGRSNEEVLDEVIATAGGWIESL